MSWYSNQQTSLNKSGIQQSSQHWNQDHRTSGSTLQRQYSQDLTQSVSSYFQSTPAQVSGPSSTPNAINQSTNMTSQQFNASAAFEKNNNTDGWGDWDWNDNTGGQNLNPTTQDQMNSWQGQSIPNNNMNYVQPHSQEQNYNNYPSYQQQMPGQHPQAAQQPYYSPNNFQQFTSPLPPQGNYQWDMSATFRPSPTTSTEVQQTHSRSTSNASSDMVRTGSMNSYEDSANKPPQQTENHLPRMPDAKNNTPQQPPMMKPNPQMARLMKTDGLSPQWSVESQVSQTSSERSNESGDLDSRSSATITSDEGGFYGHHHSHQPYVEQKANIVQEVKNVSEHEAARPPITDPSMDKLDQALFEMNVFQPTAPKGQQFQNNVPVLENNRENVLPPPPMMGNQPNFNQIVKLPSHTPSPPPAVHQSTHTPAPQSTPPMGNLTAPPLVNQMQTTAPKSQTAPPANLPPPPMASDKRGINPYKRTGQQVHHNYNFQTTAVTAPSAMQNAFYHGSQDSGAKQENPVVTQSTHTSFVEQQQQQILQQPHQLPQQSQLPQFQHQTQHHQPQVDNFERPTEIPGFRAENQETPVGRPEVSHTRGRASINQLQPSPRKDSHLNTEANQIQSNPSQEAYRPIDPSFISPRHNQVQYTMPSIEREQNQAVGQNLMDEPRRRTDSDRSQQSPHTPAVSKPQIETMHHSPGTTQRERNTSSISMSEYSEHNNQEIVPSNDRNEYLQTGHLSEDTYNSLAIQSHVVEPNDNLEPPPGLSRYVLGQPENAETTSNQEPPPGLDRMILGTELENSTELNMEREADGQVTDTSTVPPARNFPSTPRNVTSNIEIIDRNLYTVPGESGGRSSQRRIVPGVEDNSSTISSVSVSQVSPQIQTSNPEPVIPEQERELAVEGENIQDQQTRRKLETREDPIEGADTLDEGIVSNKGESESNVTIETGRKETSTNEDSDRGFYRSRRSQPDDNRPKNQRTKDKGRYPSDSDYSDKERKRYDKERNVRDREGSVNKERERDRASGRGKEVKSREYKDKRSKEDRYERHEREKRDRYGPEDPKYNRRKREDKEYEYNKEDYKGSMRRRRKERYSGDEDAEYVRSDREGGRRHRREKGSDEDDYERSDRDKRRKDRREKDYEDEDYIRSDRERRNRKDKDEKDDRRRKDDKYDRERKDRRRGERQGRYDEDYENQRRTGTKSGRSNRDDPRYAVNYYQQPGYEYNAYAYYQQHQQYFEQLRRTNPQAYAEWYNRLFYGQSQAPSQRDAATTDGRESVHSGRSSVNDNRYNRPIQQFYDPNYHRHQMNRSQNSISMMDQSITSLDYSSLQHQPHAQQVQGTYSGWNSAGPTSLQDHSYYMNDNSYYQSRIDPNISITATEASQMVEEPEQQRLTPAKFPTSHCTATLSHGILVSVKPRYSNNGFNDVVKIFSMGVNDSNKKLFQLYPGPLIRSSTHKKSVIEFCEEQIRLGPFSSAPIKSRGNSMCSIVSASQANRGSYTLLWNYLILLLRQNGSYIGTDISELLMRNKQEYPSDTPQVTAKSSNNSGRDSALSDIKEPRGGSPHHESDDEDEKHRSFDEDDDHQTKQKKSLTETEVTEKFRDYLIYGNLDEALEWATENNLWGHALFLASKVNRRQHANVMMKFANKLPLNDPLQTLYQLMSGRTPYSVTCIADEKWGDWRPHLAMIMSNEQERAELNRKSITVLGDSLYNRGDYFAAQFCYLLAGIPFGKYTDVNQESTLIPNSPNAVRLVLLGTSQHKGFKEFAINEAIIMTEIFEYAKSLGVDEFSIVELQLFKYLLATRILDYGMQLKALLYMEQISKQIVRYPSKFEPRFIERVFLLADRLKYYDPVLEKALDENNGPLHVEDQKWLQDLKEVLNQYNTGALTFDLSQTRDVSFLSTTPLPATLTQQQSQNDSILQTSQIDKEFTEINNQFSQLNLQYKQEETNQNNQIPQQQPMFYSTEPQTQQNLSGPPLQPQYPQGNDQGLQQQNQNAYQPMQTGYDMNDTANQYNYGQTTEQQQTDTNNYYSGNQQYGGYDQQPSLGYDSMQQNQASQPNSYDYWGQQSNPIGTNDETPRPSITMPGTNSNKSAYYDNNDQGSDFNKSNNLNGADQKRSATEASKKGAANKENAKPTNGNQGSGWFGGIFNKLSLKPKNQMKLPDDKNPSIVWDPDKKRWVNTEGGEEEQESFKPPPKMADIMPQMQQPAQMQPVQMQSTPVQPIQTQPTIPTAQQVPAPAATPVPLLDQSNMQSVPTMNQPQPDKSSEPAPTPRLQSNMYKLQRNRTLKKSYVDVFNPSGAPMSKPAEPILAPTMPQGPTPQTGFFVPGQAPATDSQSNGVPLYDPTQYTGYQQ